VSANRRIGERFYRLGLGFEGASSQVFAKARPGQFTQLDLCGAGLPAAENIPEELADSAGRKIMLRRPFSFCDINTKDNKTSVEILYCAVGPASLRMTTLAAGNTVSVIGPLGNGFRIPPDRKRAILVAGGMGAGPLQYLAKVLTAERADIEVVALAGAKTVKELPFERRLDEISQQLGFSLAEFAKYGIKSSVATDDGSAGFAGTVADCLLEWLGRFGAAGRGTIIYSCGPEAMLAKVAKIAKERNIDCQVCMERMMGCGVGVCQSCAVECKVEGSDETVYKLCCEDGPVFDSKEIVFSS
jgi:dihydroorotate dehydrogenase electron transfer subunit